MIWWNVVDMHLLMLFAESLDTRAFVPACSINPKVDAFVFASANNVR